MGFKSPEFFEPINPFESKFIGPIFVCLILCTVQPILLKWKFFKKEVWLSICCFLMMDLVLVVWLFAISDEAKKNEGYMYLILITNTLILFFGAFNIAFQKNHIEVNYKLIGKYILTNILSDHLDFIQTIINPDAKGTCKVAEQAFDFGEDKADYKVLDERLSQNQNWYLLKLIDQEEEDDHR